MNLEVSSSDMMEDSSAPISPIMKDAEVHEDKESRALELFRRFWPALNGQNSQQAKRDLEETHTNEHRLMHFLKSLGPDFTGYGIPGSGPDIQDPYHADMKRDYK
ncbi:hypothetical protein QJS10_CPB18g00491 [Acorus calamus]|uniref:Uncharacterized protein n=1 Tax=Acorus calamus TaxID=4465 RepID=A0AAV9CQU4_ACOCL|nr:hypothetical protein QJS10_CPB18g00491 [Acorus calamus]